MDILRKKIVNIISAIGGEIFGSGVRYIIESKYIDMNELLVDMDVSLINAFIKILKLTVLINNTDCINIEKRNNNEYILTIDNIYGHVMTLIINPSRERKHIGIDINNIWLTSDNIICTRNSADIDVYEPNNILDKLNNINEKRFRLIEPLNVVNTTYGSDYMYKVLYEAMKLHADGYTLPNNIYLKGLNRIENRKDIKDTHCFICNENIVEGDLMISTVCKHEGHAVCLMKWLIQNGTCPICRFANDEKYSYPIDIDLL